MLTLCFSLSRRFGFVAAFPWKVQKSMRVSATSDGPNKMWCLATSNVGEDKVSTSLTVNGTYHGSKLRCYNSGAIKVVSARGVFRQLHSLIGNPTLRAGVARSG